MKRACKLLVGDHFAKNRQMAFCRDRVRSEKQLEYEERPIKVSAADFLAVFI